MKKAMLLGRMFWTDKGPKYLVMLIILSLVIYMFATLLGSTNIAEDIGISSKVKFRYSEKASKFEKIFHIKFDFTEYRHILSGRFFSNFVAFSEYPNFIRNYK